jgi:hypothetical protein
MKKEDVTVITTASATSKEIAAEEKVVQIH